ncbi:hypothetical protein F5146DRAFT_204045 [Armillaria mellea]|nr:hypothetical protein F5146DRAFT_204045 [Armillaria mellea]
MTKVICQAGLFDARLHSLAISLSSLCYAATHRPHQRVFPFKYLDNAVPAVQSQGFDGPFPLYVGHNYGSLG